MRWKGREGSTNVEDRRYGGQGSSATKRTGGMGCGTIILVIVLYFIFGEGVLSVFDAGNSGGGYTQTQQQYETQRPQNSKDELGQFVSVVLKETENVWQTLFPEYLQRRYVPPKMVLYSGTTISGCGRANSKMGPFYCPADQKLYIDLSFYSELKNKFGAPGDFAMAYVVAHEVAHHVQHLLGITTEVHRKKGRISQREYNQLSVKLELQADFLSGVWAHHAHKMNNILEEGDVEEAINAAHQIGDDAIQRRMQGYIIPHSFTHGTSEQRAKWFKLGLKTGDLSQGDTFSARQL